MGNTGPPGKLGNTLEELLNELDDGDPGSEADEVIVELVAEAVLDPEDMLGPSEDGPPGNPGEAGRLGIIIELDELALDELAPDSEDEDAIAELDAPEDAELGAEDEELRKKLLMLLKIPPLDEELAALLELEPTALLEPATLLEPHTLDEETLLLELPIEEVELQAVRVETVVSVKFLVSVLGTAKVDVDNQVVLVTVLLGTAVALEVVVMVQILVSVSVEYGAGVKVVVFVTVDQ